MPESDRIIKILFVGDVVGEPGLKAVDSELPGMLREHEVDFCIVNGENAYEGKGIRPGDADRIFTAGAQVITSGNHIWERWQSKKVLTENPRVLRPLNYPPGNVGNGWCSTRVLETEVIVVNLQGLTFLPDIDCPFRAVDALLRTFSPTAVVIVDFHAEATAEKIAMGRFLDGRVAAVLGTHTHVPTSDAQIFPKGTAFITDVGMTGPYSSVIGMDIDTAIRRFLYKTPYKYETATDDARIASVLMEIDASTRKAISITPLIRPPFITAQGS